MSEVEKAILGWDYSSIISGSATLSAVTDIGRVPLVFTSVHQYAQVCRTLAAGSESMPAWHGSRWLHLHAGWLARQGRTCQRGNEWAFAPGTTVISL